MQVLFSKPATIECSSVEESGCDLKDLVDVIVPDTVPWYCPFEGPLWDFTFYRDLFCRVFYSSCFSSGV